MASKGYQGTIKLPAEDIAWLRQLAEVYDIGANQVLRIDLRNAAEDRDFVQSLPTHKPRVPKEWKDFQLNQPSWLVDLFGGKNQTRHAVYAVLAQKRAQRVEEDAPIRLACVPLNQLAAMAA